MTTIQALRILFILHLFSPNGADASGIVHGKVSKPHSRPYMASLQYQGHHACGGILVREDYVLTAAHCKDPQRMTVVLGAHDISKKEKSQQSLQVTSLCTHPKYKDGKLDYDLMLIKLKNKAKLNKYVNLIGLPKKAGTIPANVSCVVAGWGYTTANGSPSHVLKETTERIQFGFECKSIWQKHFDTNRMICTKVDKKKGGVCKGDSGGPLICNSKPQGLTSFVSVNEYDKHPHVFMNLHFFLPWIKKTMEGKGEC